VWGGDKEKGGTRGRKPQGEGDCEHSRMWRERSAASRLPPPLVVVIPLGKTKIMRKVYFAKECKRKESNGSSL
jgi:hypothetical protein